MNQSVRWYLLRCCDEILSLFWVILAYSIYSTVSFKLLFTSITGSSKWFSRYISMKVADSDLLKINLWNLVSPKVKKNKNLIFFLRFLFCATTEKFWNSTLITDSRYVEVLSYQPLFLYFQFFNSLDLEPFLKSKST